MCGASGVTRDRNCDRFSLDVDASRSSWSSIFDASVVVRLGLSGDVPWNLKTPSDCSRNEFYCYDLLSA